MITILGTKLYMGEEASKEQLTGLLSTPELSEGEPEKLNFWRF